MASNHRKCCCRGCVDCPEGLATSYTLTGHLYATSTGGGAGEDDDIDFTVTVTKSEDGCEWFGLFQTGGLTGVGGSHILTDWPVRISRVMPDFGPGCGFEFRQSGINSPGDGSFKAGDDITGSYPDITNEYAGDVHAEWTNLLVS